MIDASACASGCCCKKKRQKQLDIDIDHTQKGTFQSQRGRARVNKGMGTKGWDEDGRQKADDIN
jgi:hypothetical protein